MAGQSTSGENSPNLKDSNYNQFAFAGDIVNMAAFSKKSSNEVLSILRLISFLSERASATNLDDDTGYGVKDLDVKLGERFESYRPKIEEEYKDHNPVYGEKYAEAKRHSGLTEEHADAIALLLRRLSKRSLEQAQDDPIRALDILEEDLSQELNSTGTDFKYDQSAIRFYLLMELINCNVFPNPGIGVQ